MRIALLASPRHPIAAPFAGGLERHTHQLASGLSARGHEVVLFGHPDSAAPGRLEPVVAREDASPLGMIRPLNRAMDRIRAGRFDLIHDNSIHALAPFLSRRTGIPLVTTLHTPPYRSHRLVGRLLPATPRQRTVSISQFLAKQWAPYRRVDRVIHNGIDPAAWSFSATAEPGTAIWFGRLSPEKGAEHAIWIARVAGVRLRLAGPVADASYFEQKIRPQLGPDVEYLGQLRRPELAKAIGQASVGLFTPVWQEPFGLAYLETLACGTPVVSVADGAAPEIITPQEGALVGKGDWGAAAQVLGEVIRSRDRAACRRRVTEWFTLERMLDGYELLYRELIERP